jgi:hypothetical protein
MLANVSILEGYRWLGVLSSSPRGVGPTGFTSSRPVTVVLAGLLLGASLILTRPGPGMRRSALPASLVGAGLAVAATSCVVLLGGGVRAGTALGVADLVLAGTAIATVVPGELGRRLWQLGRADRPRPPLS